MQVNLTSNIIAVELQQMEKYIKEKGLDLSKTIVIIKIK